MEYSQNMSNEKAPKRKMLLPEGKRIFTIKAVARNVSKQQNEMFEFTVVDDETKYEEVWYAVAVEGKRFFLKQILSACGVVADKAGVFKWNDKSVVGKKVLAELVHEPNDYVNRRGETIKGLQHRVIDVQNVAWEE